MIWAICHVAVADPIIKLPVWYQMRPKKQLIFWGKHVFASLTERKISNFAGDRGHEFKRSKNSRTGEEEEVKNFMNMEEGSN